MDRKGRAAAKQLRDSNDRIAQAEPLEEPGETDEPEMVESLEAAEGGAEKQETAGETPVSDRDILMEKTMVLYRQRRAEYEKLDEGVRTKMTKLATDQFGDKKP